MGGRCPQVAVPITKPALPWKAEDTYKVQFSFDGEGFSACVGEPGSRKVLHPFTQRAPSPGHC